MQRTTKARAKTPSSRTQWPDACMQGLSCGFQLQQTCVFSITQASKHHHRPTLARACNKATQSRVRSARSQSPRINTNPRCFKLTQDVLISHGGPRVRSKDQARSSQFQDVASVLNGLLHDPLLLHLLPVYFLTAMACKETTSIQAAGSESQATCTEGKCTQRIPAMHDACGTACMLRSET